jgi:hypothetical protein
MANADALMLTGVLRYCSDCNGERIFVEPDPDASAEFACTTCGAALFIDSAMFASAGVEGTGESLDATDHLTG